MLVQVGGHRALILSCRSVFYFLYLTIKGNDVITNKHKACIETNLGKCFDCALLLGSQLQNSCCVVSHVFPKTRE